MTGGVHWGSVSAVACLVLGVLAGFQAGLLYAPPNDKLQMSTWAQNVSAASCWTNESQSPSPSPSTCASDSLTLSKFVRERGGFMTISEVAQLYPCCANVGGGRPATLDDVLVVVISSLAKRERTEVARRTWALEFPHVIFVGEVDDPDLGMITVPSLQGLGSYTDAGRRQLALMQHLASTNSTLTSKPYYLFVDDDTFVNWRRLQSLMATLNPACPLYTGFIFDHKFVADLNYASGGGGFLITNECMRRVTPLAFSPYCPYAGFGDVLFGRCAVSAECVPLHAAQFNWGGPPTAAGDENYLFSVVLDAVTFHYVSAPQMELLHKYLRDRPDVLAVERVVS